MELLMEKTTTQVTNYILPLMTPKRVYCEYLLLKVRIKIHDTRFNRNNLVA